MRLGASWRQLGRVLERRNGLGTGSEGGWIPPGQRRSGSRPEKRHGWRLGAVARADPVPERPVPGIPFICRDIPVQRGYKP